MELLVNDEIDFHTTTRFYFSSNFMTQMENMQNMSYPLEFLQNLVSVPTPKYLNAKYYPVKPFDMAIWSCIGLITIYATLFINLGLKLKRRQSDLFYIWENVIRATIAVAYPLYEQENPNLIKLSLILLNLMGFVITTLYSSMLGSFVTTYLKEPPISSFEDIRKANLKILLSIPYEYVLKKFHVTDDVMDLFQLVETDTYRSLRNNLSRNAYIEMSDRWNYYSVKRQQFYENQPFHILDIDLLSMYTFMNVNHNSVYKWEFNKFILFSQSLGLYQHWGDSVFLDTLKYKVFKHGGQGLPIRTLKVLSLNFFVFIYSIWGLGLLCGMVAFSIEITWHKLMK